MLFRSIAEYVSKWEKALYNESALKLITAIDEKWCDYNPNTDGIVDGGSTSYHDKMHHEKIIYGDYFFIEAALRTIGKHLFIW